MHALDTYRRLGKSGLAVSPLCLGTMMFGGRTNEADSAAIVAKAKDQGCNFIDTADAYNGGASEEVVGRAIKADRQHWILATKVGNAVGKGQHDKGLSRRHLIEGCEASLRRLGTEWIDLYYCHLEDHDTPLEETVAALGMLIDHGKIRYFALSNFRSWRIAEVVRICDALGITRPVASQPYYNALNRMPEVEHLPACGHYGLGVVPYSPLARGVLTAKYQPGAAPGSDTRAGVSDVRMMETEWREESLVIAQKIRDHMAAKGRKPGDFALRWVLNNRFVTSVLAGPRTMEQWDGYVDALSYAFTADDEALLDRLVPAGHPSTPGYTDPRYPLEGRVTWTG